jgi:hypothetical protein
MALLGNVSSNHRNPQRHFGQVTTGSTAFAAGNERMSWNQSGPMLNFSGHESRPTGGNKTGYPSGRRHPYSWSMAVKPGGMASIQVSEGVAAATGAIAGGRNGVGTSAGQTTATATLQLVVTGTGTSDGVATVIGNVYAALIGMGTSAGEATATATRTALGWASGTSNGVATGSLLRYATGALSGSIAPAITLEAASFSTYLLDDEDIESGLTLRQAMRLVAAATAGKIAGSGSPTITIRNAVADSKNRITATVDGSGNRTALTYDLAD